MTDNIDEAAKLVRVLTDKKLRLSIQITGAMFKVLKDEAKRRGIWDDIIKAGGKK